MANWAERDCDCAGSVLVERYVILVAAAWYRVSNKGSFRGPKINTMAWLLGFVWLAPSRRILVWRNDDGVCGLRPRGYGHATVDVSSD